MSRPRLKRDLKRKVLRTEEESPRYGKPLLIIFLIALAIGAVTVFLSNFERPMPVLYTQEVELYYTHGCRCAFEWARSLREEGFRVHVHERETLRNVRARLHTPENFKACHVGSFMGYFVEGHVSPDAIVKLTHEHVAGIGVVTESTIRPGMRPEVPEGGVDDVLIVEPDGSIRRWYSASNNQGGGVDISRK